MIEQIPVSDMNRKDRAIFDPACFRFTVMIEFRIHRLHLQPVYKPDPPDIRYHYRSPLAQRHTVHNLDNSPNDQ